MELMQSTDQAAPRPELYAKMGKFVVAHNPHILVALGLGSCVGVALHDPVSRIGGLAHVMLPDSTKFSANQDQDKFADVAIPKMMDEMVRFGAKKESIVAKIAGGAQMFGNVTNPEMDIPKRNVEAVKEALRKENISLIAEDTGLDFGRTIRLDTITGSLEISTKMREKVYKL